MKAEEIREKIVFLKKQIEECHDDAKAISLQKELIDLLSSVFKNKEMITEIIKRNGVNN